MLAASAATILLGLAAATPSWAAVGEGRTIETFHGIEFVGLDGYPTNTDITVDVLRGPDDVVIGSTTQRVNSASGLLEINHVGGGPFPGGDCWGPTPGVTPDILPGDTIRATYTDAGGTEVVDTSAVRNVFIEEPVVGPPGTNTITVTGHARTLDNAPIAPGDTVELRLNANGFTWDQSAGGRKDLRHDVAAEVDPATGDFSYTFDVSETERQNAADNGFESAVEWSATPVDEAAGLPEITVYDGSDLEGGGCPPRVSYAVTGSDPQGINSANVGNDLVVSGAAFDASAVRVDLDDEDPNTPPLTADATLSAASGAQSWTAKFVGGAGVLSDGRLTAKGIYTKASGAIDGADLTLSKDTAAPAPPTLDLVAQSDSGESNEDNLTNDPTPTVSGTAEAGSTVRISDGTRAMGDVKAAADGAYAFTADALTAGVHSIKATAADAAGNASAQSTLDVTIDTQAPRVSVDPGGNLFNSDQSVTLRSDDPDARIFFTLDGTTPDERTPYTGPIGITRNAALKYAALDKAGNRSDVGTQAYEIDKVAPKLSASPAPGRSYDSTQRVTLRASEPGTIYFTTNGGTPTTRSARYAGPITVNRSQTIRALAMDRAGNRSFVASYAYTIRQRSFTSLRVSTANLKLGQSRVISGRVSPAHPGKTVTLTIKRNGKNVLVRNLRLNGASSYSFRYRPNGVGRYTVSVRFAGDRDHRSDNSPTRSFKTVRR